jgi:hypothetical protein
VKKINLLLIIYFILCSFYSFADAWTQKSSFPGIGRALPVSFSIGNKGYVGGGFLWSNAWSDFIDFWEYDQYTNTWTQKADYGGGQRSFAVGFSISNKGYIGGGLNANHMGVSDFWEYDPLSNSWTRKADLGGGSAVYSTAFSIGVKGYICYWGSISYIWQWDQTTNVWTQMNSLPGSGRSYASGFSINGKGYICCGWDTAYNNLNDLWEYDTLLNNWTQKANLPAIARRAALGFSICGKGYVGLGFGSSFLNDFWQYDPILNQWIQKTNFPGSIRINCAYFSIGNRGYIGLGWYGDSISESYFSSLWQYSPDSSCIDTNSIDSTQTPNPILFSVYPNPVNNIVNIQLPALDSIQDLRIIDILGKVIYEQTNCGNYISINVSKWDQGIYFYQITDLIKTKQGKLVIERK